MLFADENSWKDAAVFVTALGVLVSAVFSGIAALYAAKAKAHAAEASTQSAATAESVIGVKDGLAAVKGDVRGAVADLKVVKAQTDGLTRALVKAEKTVSLAEGKVIGAAEEKAKGNGGADSGPENLGT